jgi:pyrimidine-specific ribonucleoside hydrolase
MIAKIFFCFALLTGLVSVQAQKKPKPLAVIFDSDMGPDYDDVGAITLLHAYADSGYAKILATVASTKYEGVAAVLNVLNTYFQRPAIPIGIPKGRALELKDRQHWTDTLLLKYPHKIKTNAEVPDAVEIYRKVLSSQPDKTVMIITVGFLTNLSNLLQSPPDKYSRLNGKNLVRQKVRQLVCMGGSFPAGSEFNLDQDAMASQFVFNNWETPILFSGVEIGWKIRTGLPLVNDKDIHNSPVKDVFRICIPQDAQDSAGRMSWDETAVLVAIKGYKPWYQIQKGKIVVAGDGTNKWINQPSLHSYLVELQSPLMVEELINKLLLHQPLPAK